MFLFLHSYSGEGLGATHLDLHPSTRAEKETHDIQYGPLLFVSIILYLILIQTTMLKFIKYPPIGILVKTTNMNFAETIQGILKFPYKCFSGFNKDEFCHINPIWSYMLNFVPLY